MGFTKLLRKIATGSSELNATDSSKPINITAKLSSITVRHQGKPVVIERNQDTHAKINDLFAKTSRPCPPFCVQPMTIAPNVDTIGELEMLDCLQQADNQKATDESILIIDSRIKEWVEKGTIPSAKHIPWTSLVISDDNTLNDVMALLKQSFGVKIAESTNAGEMSAAFEQGNISEKLDFSKAKTLVLFCNGSWCGQTPEAIQALLALSYPADKLKYFRDGMQGWLSLGLTTVTSQSKKSSKTEPACKLITK